MIALATPIAKDKPASRSEALAAKLLYAVFQALQEAGGQLPSKEVNAEAERRVPLDEWAREEYKSTGEPRWRKMLHFFSIDCVKAGFLIKKQGIWYLTDEGMAALALGEAGMFQAARSGYKEWARQRDEKAAAAPASVSEIPLEADDIRSRELTLEEVEEKAAQGLRGFVEAKTPYDFQELIAALLRGMGYYTPFVAPKGKDGGVDIIAYRDPLGTVAPRIKVQVKHRGQSASVQEIRELMGLLQKDGDVGMFVSTGGFTSDARQAARNSHVHVELVDFERFLALWLEFYPKLGDEDKARLPLRPVYFLAPEE